jgi:hypothetical protein
MKRYIYILFFAATITSCEFMLFEGDLASSDPFVNFDFLWEEVDQRYSYHELKDINWENIKLKYRPKLYNGMTEDSLFLVLGAMLNELRDDHVNLFSPFNISFYNVELTGQDNLNIRTLQEHYFNDVRITGPFLHYFLENKRVGYIRYRSFIDLIDETSLDHILTRYKDTEGLIFDLRSNGGGYILNVPQILERFSSNRKLVGYTITRNGPDKKDFGPKEPFHIGAHKGITYNKPVMVLIDRGSYSATSFFALATKAYPNLVLVGDTTGGGGGLPAGGQLPNGWSYRFSVSQLLDLDGNNYAENGVPPDIEVNFDWSDLTKDEIIERAIEEIYK